MLPISTIQKHSSKKGALSHIPLIGSIVKLICDPMLGNSLSLNDGLPKAIRNYVIANPDAFVTKRLLRKLSDSSKK